MQYKRIWRRGFEWVYKSILGGGVALLLGFNGLDRRLALPWRAALRRRVPVCPVDGFWHEKAVESRSQLFDYVTYVSYVSYPTVLRASQNMQAKTGFRASRSPFLLNNALQPAAPPHRRMLAVTLPPLRRVPDALLCASDADDSAVEELGGDDHSGLLIRRLLTQRSVQTQLKYQMEFKNGFAQQWLTRFTTEQGAAPLVVGSPARGQQKVLHCHHAMRRVEWDRYMLDMLSAPEETHVVSVMRGGGSPGRRLSKGNPYLKKVQQQQQQPWRTYSDTVRPGQLARQILQIREHIAAEWVRDLTLIERENDELREAS